MYGTEPDGSLDDKARLISAILRREGLDPNETIMVGDRSHDVIGAHANELRAVGVPGATAVVKNCSRLARTPC